LGKVRRAQFAKARMRAKKCAGKIVPSNRGRSFRRRRRDYLLDRKTEKIICKKRRGGPDFRAAKPFTPDDSFAQRKFAAISRIKSAL
jgi:hypothetical protein